MNAFEAHGISHLSPSTIAMFVAQPAAFVATKVMRRSLPVGDAAHRGTAVEAGIVHGLLHPEATREECAAIALSTFKDISSTKDEKELKALEGMVNQGLDALAPYGMPSHTQGRVEWTPDGLAVPIIGFFDVYYEQHGILVDIKTTHAVPSEIKTGHARQVSFYCGCISDNLDGRLAYISSKKNAVYQLENMRDHRDAILKGAMTIQKFLSLSKDPDELASLVMPDTESFYWSGPAARQVAHDIWKV